MALHDITNVTTENIPPGVDAKEDPSLVTPDSAITNMTVPHPMAQEKSKEKESPESAVTSSAQNSAAKSLENLENFTCKHPLMNEWTLWFTKPPTGKVRIE